MVTHEELIGLWGDDGVCRPTSDQLEATNMPHAAKVVLREIGLPTSIKYFFETDLCSANEHPRPVASKHTPERWHQIGRDPEMPVCVEAESGEVWSIADDIEYSDRFMNSSVGCLMEFLYRVTKHRATYMGLSDQEAEASVESLEAHMRSLDPRAFNSSQTWWSEIFQQMKFGLL